jgi:hypothetical protein
VNAGDRLGAGGDAARRLARFGRPAGRGFGRLATIAEGASTQPPVQAPKIAGRRVAGRRSRAGRALHGGRLAAV